jgi:hypothetical protein
MQKEELKAIREKLFDENFKPKYNDVPTIKEFCQELANKTGIQCCTHYGAMYEYVEEVYNSVIAEGM